MSSRNVYVHVDSSNRLKTDQYGSIRVHMPHGLENATRVAVKSLSLPNTLDNAYGELHRLRWIEYYKSTPSSNDQWQQKEFYIDLSDIDNYTTNAQIVNEINTRLSDPAKVYSASDGSTGHKFSNEQPMTIQLSYDATNYKVSILASSTLHKVFSIARDGSELGLWEQLGFSNAWKYASADDLSLTARIANYVPILTGASSSGDQSASAMNLALKKEFYAVNAYSVQTLNTPALRTLLAPHHSFHENHFSGLFLCSDALAGDGFECIQQGAVNVSVPSNVLEWVRNSEPKFSFLHHESTTLTWHVLKDTSIRTFDIQLRDHRGRRFDASAIPNYNLTLVFETIDPVMYTKEFLEEYNKEGWKRAHPIRRQ